MNCILGQRRDRLTSRRRTFQSAGCVHTRNSANARRPPCCSPPFSADRPTDRQTRPTRPDPRHSSANNHQLNMCIVLLQCLTWPAGGALPRETVCVFFMRACGAFAALSSRHTARAANTMQTTHASLDAASSPRRSPTCV